MLNPSKLPKNSVSIFNMLDKVYIINTYYNFFQEEMKRKYANYINLTGLFIHKVQNERGKICHRGPKSGWTS